MSRSDSSESDGSFVHVNSSCDGSVLSLNSWNDEITSQETASIRTNDRNVLSDEVLIAGMDSMLLGEEIGSMSQDDLVMNKRAQVNQEMKSSSNSEQQPTESSCSPLLSQLLFTGTLKQAITLARHQKKLVLVSLQDYNGDAVADSASASSFAVTRDVFELEQFQNLVSDRYVFVQFSANSSEGRGYAERYQICHFPHLGILHPFHHCIRMLWGLDGWSISQPWDPRKVVEALVDWGYERFTEEHFKRMTMEQQEKKTNRYHLASGRKRLSKKLECKRQTRRNSATEWIARRDLQLSLKARKALR